MITEDYCSYEVAKMLKEKGFKEMCPKAYGISVKYNGKEIDEDEEYELKCQGKEIEYINGGCLYTMWDDNTFAENVYACPTHQTAVDYIRKNKNIFIEIDFDSYEMGYGYALIDTKTGERFCCSLNTYEEPYMAVEEGLKHTLKIYI